MGFFQDNANRLASLVLEEKATYRECQVGATWATQAHFTASSEPALISMPTGSGKTALMMILSFLLKAERVIIVTPSVVLRGQTAGKFEKLEDLKSFGAYPTGAPDPSVHEQLGPEGPMVQVPWPPQVSDPHTVTGTHCPACSS